MLRCNCDMLFQELVGCDIVLGIVGCIITEMDTGKSLILCVLLAVVRRYICRC